MTASVYKGGYVDLMSLQGLHGRALLANKIEAARERQIEVQHHPWAQRGP
jgi:hypothetical protein